MTLLFYDPLFLEHNPRTRHPERAERLTRAWEELAAADLVSRCQQKTIEPLDEAAVLAVHAATQYRLVQQTCANGQGFVDPDTPVSARSLEVALLAAGSGTAAVDAVLAGESANAFCLVRPPGHHATPTRSMGFCLFNNVALAARRAIDRHGIERILIVDYDVHHGNGTQDIFYSDRRVFFFSAHRFPFYPGTGGSAETGAGDGRGFTLNLPIAFGTRPADYRARFEQCLTRAAETIEPQLVLLSAGYDAHRDDPIGGLDLELDDFAALDRLVARVADTYAAGRQVSLLEGGYNVAMLGQCVVQHVRHLLERASR